MMRRLDQRDLRALFGCLREIYAPQNLDRFRSGVLSALRTAVASAFSSYNEIDHRRRRVAWVVEPADALVPDLEPIFARHMHQHPFLANFARTGDGRPRKLSDFLSRSRLHRLPLYNEVYRVTGVEHQMALALPVPAPAAIIIGIDRGRDDSDFSERDRLVLDLLRPDLVQAYRNAVALTDARREAALLGRAVDALGRGVVALGPDGGVSVASPRGEELLAKYFGVARPPAAALPDDLQRWVQHQERLLHGAEDDLPPPRAPLVVERGGKRLLVRLLSGPDSSVLVFKEQRPSLEREALGQLGLTAREAEVLAWVARGKTNADIAAILGTRPKTVGKHLERIYQKLGVETRTAAVVAARETALFPT